MRRFYVIIAFLLCIGAVYLVTRPTATPADAPLHAEEHGSKTWNGKTSERGSSVEARSRPSAERARQDAAAAARQALAAGNPDVKRMDRWIKFLAIMRLEDGPAIHELLQAEAKAGREVDGERAAFWQTWASLDPAGAWAFATQNAAEGGASGLEEIMKVWARDDLPAAADAVGALDDPQLARTAYGGLLGGLALSRPDLAVDFAIRHLPADLHEFAATKVTGAVISQLGNQEAQAWFDTLPADVAPGFQKESARVFLDSLSKADPGAVEKFAMERLGQEWGARRDEQHFVAQMIHKSGGSPWAYISAATEKVPHAEDPLSLPKWSALRQPEQAAEWIAAHPNHPSIDTIRAGAAQALFRQGNVEAAEEMILQIRDRDLAERARSSD